MHRVTLIPGDGIGPEITESVKSVIEASKVSIEWDVKAAGQKAVKECGSPLPEDVIDSIKQNKIALKGPVTTQVGKGFRSINVALRQALDLYSNIRPVRNLPGVKSKYENVDLVIFRENTEDLYAGIERAISDDRVEALKVITRGASRRIAERAFKYSIDNGRKKVMAIHKANIMKLSDGLFLEETRAASKNYPEIQYEELIVDNACMKLVQRPQDFDVVVTENLYGDILSDLCAGLVGGLGIVPGINMGDGYAVFEAVHGSAPDIAGKNIANPTALILSAVEMLKYMGEDRAADKISNALREILNSGKCTTPDLGGSVHTDEFTMELCRKIKSGG
jgi:isocitrate dehydrogenase (NAD+)